LAKTQSLSSAKLDLTFQLNRDSAREGSSGTRVWEYLVFTVSRRPATTARWTISVNVSQSTSDHFNPRISLQRKPRHIGGRTVVTSSHKLAPSIRLFRPQ